jgi:hypothetical protein
MPRTTKQKPAARNDGKQARQGYFYCSVKPTTPRVFGPGVNADRASAISTLGVKWVNGTELSYYFFDKPTDGTNITLADGSVRFVPWRGAANQLEAVRKGFKAWADLGIGIKFKVARPTRHGADRPQPVMFRSYIGRAIRDNAVDRAR